MCAFLYINSSGKPWRKHSYSAGNTFDQCAKKYFLQKVLGWKEKDIWARFQLGKAFETAVQHHHENDGQGAVERFIKEWNQYKDAKELKYTKVEKDWATCLRAGTEAIRLYIIRQPELPIPLGGQAVFQREVAKEVFPGDPTYGEIEDAGKLDIISYADPAHPKLPKLIWKPEYGPFRPVIIDIKTSGVDFPEQYGLAALDVQLRRYSWLSGIRDVALLVWVKKGHSLQKGSSITLLEDAGSFKAGQEAVIAQLDGDEAYLLANDFMIEEMERAQGKNANGKTEQTKAAKEKRDLWLREFGVKVPVEIITKQRLQFNAGYVTIESAQEAGMIAGRQIQNIVQAWHSKQWPNTFGIRYPHDDRSDPYFRAFILEDEAYRNQNFTKSDDTTMDDLFADIEVEEDR
jgi:hypothetical protein